MKGSLAERIIFERIIKRIKIGLVLLGIALVALLAKHYFIKDIYNRNLVSFIVTIVIAISLLLIIPFELAPKVIFDNSEWEPNKTIPELVNKIRHRSILFFNLAIGIFIVTLIVIIVSYYLLVGPHDPKKQSDLIENIITIRISATALVIFLVQILFRVFKYLLRVASFYTAKADAIELHTIKPEIDLVTLMNAFTPDKYDINDISNPTIPDKIKSPST